MQITVLYGVGKDLSPSVCLRAEAGKGSLTPNDAYLPWLISDGTVRWEDITSYMELSKYFKMG